MARRDNVWSNRVGGYIEVTSPSGWDILVRGSSKYLNFNTLVGETGYGLRDNVGQIQFKHSGGSWGDIIKVKELDSCIEKYYKILKENNIQIHRFSYYKPQNNANIEVLLKEKLCL